MEENLHHCVVIGEHAQASRPYEFVVRCRLHPDEGPIQGSTIMTHEEYEVVTRVVRRTAQAMMRQVEKVPD